MRTTRGLVLALASGATLLAASAAPAQDTGLYIGAAAGQSSYRDMCHDAEVMAGSPGAFDCLHKEATGAKAFAGWRFHRNLAVEFSYIDFGQARASGTVGGAEVTATTSAEAAGLSALGFLPLREQLWVFGRLGLLGSRVSSRTEGAVSTQDNHTETELHVGIGALFQLGRDWGIRAEYERMNETRIDLISLGAQYRF